MHQNIHCKNFKKSTPRPSVTFSDIMVEDLIEKNQKRRNSFPSEKTPLSSDFEENKKENRKNVKLKCFACWDIFEEINEDNKDNKLEIDGEDEEKIKINFFVWCAPLPLIKCTRFIGWLSIALLLVETFLLFKTNFSSFIDLIPELIFLIIQMISVLSLFYGIEQKQPKYLKPFLYVGVLWNLALLLLLIFCLIELIVAGEHFCEQIELTLNDFLDGVRGEPTTMSSFETPAFFNEFGAYSTSESKHSNLAIQLFGEDQSRSDDQPALTEYSTETTNSQTPIWPALTLLSALLIAILIDCWLLNIVLITYLYLERGKRREII